MQQLSGLDTTFLNIETPTTYGHISGLAIFDPADATPGSYEDLKGLLEERLHLVPPFRRRLVEVPFGIDQPYWIEDPNFDLDFHVRHIGLPAPGSREQLAELVARIVARPLDRSRPLWELYLIEGLEHGYVAQLTKVHHCAFDGISGAESMAATLDLEPTPRKVEPPEHPWEPDREPTDLEMFNRGLIALSMKPLKDYRLFVETLNNLPELARAAGIEFPELGRRRTTSDEGRSRMLSEAATKPPRTFFNSVISPHRRFAFTSIPLDDLKAIKNAFGVTLNDVVLAICADALRRYLDDHDDLPDDPLIAMVPISVRTDDRAGEPGNQVASMTTSLHTDLDDPTERLTAIHASMKIAKDQHQAIPAALQQDYADGAPPAIAAQTARMTVRAAADGWIDLPYNVVISNVPGPQFPLYGVGAPLLASYPVSTITDGSGLNITCQSYNGNLDVGVVGCRELVPDIWDIVEYLTEATTELSKRTKQSKQRAAKKQTTAKKKTAAKKQPTRQATKARA